jgi:hypothetical protein
MNKFVTVEISKGLSDAIKDIDMLGEVSAYWRSIDSNKVANELDEIKDVLGFKWGSQALMYLVATKAYKTKEPMYYLTKTFMIDGIEKTFYKEYGNDLVTDKVNALMYTEEELKEMPMFTTTYNKEEVK